jgi:hypothetical protein
MFSDNAHRSDDQLIPMDAFLLLLLKYVSINPLAFSGSKLPAMTSMAF